jgi:hypothetical protein
MEIKWRLDAERVDDGRATQLLMGIDAALCESGIGTGPFDITENRVIRIAGFRVIAATVPLPASVFLAPEARSRVSFPGLCRGAI